MEMADKTFRVAIWVQRSDNRWPDWKKQIQMWIVPDGVGLGKEEAKHCIITDSVTIPEEKYNTFCEQITLNKWRKKTTAAISNIFKVDGTVNLTYVEEQEEENQNPVSLGA